MRLLLTFNNESLKFFEIAGGDVKPFFVQGKKIVYYFGGQLADEVGKVLKNIANEWNLESVQKEDGRDFYQGISFLVLESSDKELTKRICQAFDGYLENKVVTAEEVIAGAFSRFKADALIFNGINYDGANYQQTAKGGLKRSGFNLLAYTLKDDDIMDIVRQLIGKN